MKKSKGGPSAYLTEEAQSSLIQGLYASTPSSELLAPMLKDVVEAALSGELSAHLAEEQMAGISNRRNGQQSKTVRSEYGPWEIESSRDRNGSFKPKLIGKHEQQLRNGVH